MKTFEPIILKRIKTEDIQQQQQQPSFQNLHNDQILQMIRKINVQKQQQQKQIQPKIEETTQKSNIEIKQEDNNNISQISAFPLFQSQQLQQDQNPNNFNMFDKFPQLQFLSQQPDSRQNSALGVSQDFHNTDSSFQSSCSQQNISTANSMNTNKNQSQQQQKKNINDNNNKKDGKKQFICPHCSKGYSNKSYMNKHINEVHSTKEKYCKSCDQFFSLDHIQFQIHQDKCLKIRVCTYCGKGGMNYDERDQHMLKEHRERILEKESQMFLECHICHKQNFKTQNILKQHIKKQHTEQNLECKYCGKNGFCRTTLMRHYKQKHIFDQTCQECGQSGLCQDDMDQHYKMHNKNNENNNGQSHTNGIVIWSEKDQEQQNLKKQKMKNQQISLLIKEDMVNKQKRLEQQIEQINDSQLPKYALKKSSYTNKINRILNL